MGGLTGLSGSSPNIHSEMYALGRSEDPVQSTSRFKKISDWISSNKTDVARVIVGIAIIAVGATGIGLAAEGGALFIAGFIVTLLGMPITALIGRAILNTLSSVE